jgi:hypothetical protein
MKTMTKLMEKALEAVRDWPAERQDDAADLAVGARSTRGFHA